MTHKEFDMMCNRGRHLIKVAGRPCSQCAKERQTAQRHRNAEGRKLAQALQDRRVPLDPDRIAEGHRLLVVLDMARAVDREIR
ncbi:hypothetical protein H7J70_00375 [Mycolicibacterium celeriflavum]|uniref:Uncharacterized protein n=1 Tax=Mycolicibacterium celeriflavum TaxID=1249101 RepID=A0A1X0BKR0_MYCCF|nr:hypothetical protein [Mycolicibacterium celeriflavum]MCV7236555.1 hypothetical protein [Mycolicibacterium celeriflavum]ORA43054.1 hypothetical protein BST21_22515 [Mycolicibacterium celeriflavum]BBY41802.1 hypothetical protein MCEL_00970 [Mycolicibacterium celeriflavum]